MKRVYYKNDFDFLLSVRMADGQHVGWPQFDWSARFYTITPANSFTASCIKGECVNCYNDNGRIHIVAKDHRLSAGALRVIFVAHVPDISYADGYRKETVTMTLNDIVLTSDKGAVDIVLGAEAGADRAAYQLDKRIRRGIMPFKARRGIMYYNMGAVKVAWQHWGAIGRSKIVSDTERVFDLSRFASVIGGNNAKFDVTHNGKPFSCYPDPEDKKWIAEHVSYDSRNCMLTLRGNGEQMKEYGVIVYRNTISDNYWWERKSRDSVVFIDADGNVRIYLAGEVGAVEFQHELTGAQAQECMDRIFSCGLHIPGSAFMIGGKYIRIWRYKALYKKKGTRNSPKPIRMRRFFLWGWDDKYHTYRRGGRWRRLYKLQIKTNKGYTSRMIRIGKANSRTHGSQAVVLD